MTDQNTTPPSGMPRIMLTPEQAAAALGIGRTTMFALIKSGEVESVRIGRLRRVPLDSIEAYTRQLIAEQTHEGA
jgi:excisionase family DNA binding protein